MFAIITIAKLVMDDVFDDVVFSTAIGYGKRGLGCTTHSISRGCGGGNLIAYLAYTMPCGAQLMGKSRFILPRQI